MPDTEPTMENKDTFFFLKKFSILEPHTYYLLEGRKSYSHVITFATLQQDLYLIWIYVVCGVGIKPNPSSPNI